MSSPAFPEFWDRQRRGAAYHNLAYRIVIGGNAPIGEFFNS